MTRRRKQGKGSLELAGKTWRMQYYVNGKKTKETTGCADRSAAEKVLQLRLAELGVQKVHGVVPGQATIGDLWSLVETDHRIQQIADRANAKSRWHNHIEKRWGKIKAARLGTKQINAYIEERRAEGAKPGTINHELSLVRHGFNLGAAQEPPLIMRVPPFSMLENVDSVRQGFLEPDEYELLLEKLPLRLKALFVCAYHVGTRKGELRKVKWEQIDWDACLIRLAGKQTKNKRPRTLPIYGDMRRWLEDQLARRRRMDNPYVFFGKGRDAVARTLTGWREACEAAGFDDLLFHDLRRSAVRNMKRAGVQDSVSMDITGHRTRSMFDRYNIIDENDLSDAAGKLEAYVQKRKQERAAKLKLA